MNIGELVMQRNNRGRVSVYVQTLPEIEEVFSAGTTRRLTSSREEENGLWMPAEDGQELMIYQVRREDKLDVALRQAPFTITHPGARLFLGTNVPNISFIRLVGVSKGIEFQVDEMFSTDGLQTCTHALGQAIASFYNALVVPVEAKVVIEEER